MRNILLIIFFGLFATLIVPGLSQSQTNISSLNSDEPTEDPSERWELEGSKTPATSVSKPVKEVKVESIFLKIYNNFFGGDVAKVGFIASIPVAIGSAIIWAKIFLIIYHVFWVNGSKDLGGGSLGPTYDNRRSITGEISNFIFSAIEKFSRVDEKI